MHLPLMSVSCFSFLWGAAEGAVSLYASHSFPVILFVKYSVLICIYNVIKGRRWVILTFSKWLCYKIRLNLDLLICVSKYQKSSQICGWTDKRWIFYWCLSFNIFCIKTLFTDYVVSTVINIVKLTKIWNVSNIYLFIFGSEYFTGTCLF